MTSATVSRIEAGPQPALENCYHCGESVPAGTHLSLHIDGQERAMCCPGCRAVAQLICDNDLAHFYQQRTAYNDRPTSEQGNTDDYRIYDDPEVLKTFSEANANGEQVAYFLLGGVTCAACTWLIEHSLNRCAGVISACVNLQQSKLSVCFQPEHIQVSQIFSEVRALGYQVRPFQQHAQREQLARENRDELRRLGVAGLGMMQVGMFAIALHAGDLQGIDHNHQGLLRWTSLLVASFVVLYASRPFFINAWRHALRRTLVMDLPVSLAIGLAWLASVFATLTGSGQVYFDSVVMFTFFLLLGRFLERKARLDQDTGWLQAQDALPDAVSVRKGNHWATLPRTDVAVGDQILIAAGDAVPIDALVSKGRSAVREDAFNGEHQPRTVAEGDTVFAGTINIESSLQARVLCTYRDSRLAELQRSIDRGQAHKPALVRLADRVASWFIAAILLISMITWLIWHQLAPEQAFWITLSVLVISCPCALALATPAALASAAGALRRRGIIIRTEDALESLSQSRHIIFDKTGTLTKAELAIDRVVTLGNCPERQVLAIAAALQAHSRHPISKAFKSLTMANGVDQVHYNVGAGLQGKQGNKTYRMGSESFCRVLAPNLPPAPSTDLYWVALCGDRQPLAWIGLCDKLRPEATDTVRQSIADGFSVELLTGDSSGNGALLAHNLGLHHYACGLSPEQKMAHVKALQQSGTVVTMVGDGLNDAPVLSLADVSFAVADAADLARAQADFVLYGDDLNLIHVAHEKARQCRRVMRQNISWALTYNACAIPLAAMGFVPPWLAAVGMSASSLFVVLNSLRLNRENNSGAGQVDHG